MEACYQIVVIALGVWRLSHLFACEQGPLSMFEIIRFFAPDWLKPGLECVWCNSVWFGTLGAILFLVKAWWFFLPFALSALAIILEELLQCVIAEEEEA